MNICIETANLNRFRIYSFRVHLPSLCQTCRTGQNILSHHRQPDKCVSSSWFLEKTGQGLEEVRCCLPDQLREAPAAGAGTVPCEPVLGDLRGTLAMANRNTANHLSTACPSPGVRDSEETAGGASGEYGRSSPFPGWWSPVGCLRCCYTPYRNLAF